MDSLIRSGINEKFYFSFSLGYYYGAGYFCYTKFKNIPNSSELNLKDICMFKR